MLCLSGLVYWFQLVNGVVYVGEILVIMCFKVFFIGNVGNFSQCFFIKILGCVDFVSYKKFFNYYFFSVNVNGVYGGVVFFSNFCGF